MKKINTKKELNTQINKIKEMCNDESNVLSIAILLQIMEEDTLAQNVYKQLGGEDTVESMLDIINDFNDISKHSMDCGFQGFIYIEDTVKFFDENKDEILKRIAQQAQDCGYKNKLEMINNFQCIKQSENPNITMNDIIEACNNKGVDDKTYHLKNALSWYAGEDIINKYDDLAYNTKILENIDPKFIDKAKSKLQNYANKTIQSYKKEFAKNNANEMNM